MKYLKIFKTSVKEFFQDEPLSYSSSIAFYVIFSLPAILIIVVTVAGSVFEDQIVRENLFQQMRQLFGPDSSEAVQKVLENAGNTGSTLITKIIGLVALMFSATTVFVSLQNGLNKIWGVRLKPENNLLVFLKDRLLSFAMVMSLGFLLLVSLAVDTALQLINQSISEVLSESSYLLVSGLNILISIILITLIFAIIFKILPDAKIKWRDVWLGAFITTVLFTIGKFLLGFLIANSNYGDVYGAAGSLVLLLLWVFFSSTIVLFGAKYTVVYSKEFGHKVKSEEGAVVVEEVEKEHGIVNK